MIRSILLALALMLVSGHVLAADACDGKTREAAIADATSAAKSIGKMIEITDDAGISQTVADGLYKAAGQPSHKVAGLVRLDIGNGVSLVALIDPNGCYMALVQVKTETLDELTGKGA